MKKTFLFLFGILLNSMSFGQISTVDLAREYLLTNGSLVNSVNPGVNDLVVTGTSSTMVSDLTGSNNTALLLNGDSFNGENRGGQTDITVSFWFKSSNVSATSDTIMQQYSNSNFGPYGWYIELVDGKIKATSKIFNGSVILPIILESTNVIADGCWHHVAFTAYQHQQPGYIAQGYTRYLWIDNVFQVSGANFFSGTLTPNFNHPSEPVIIAPSGLNYSESIDNIRIYNRILYAADVAELFKEYNATMPIVYVDKDATGCNNGSSWSNAYTSLSTALSFSSGDQDFWVADGTYHPHASDRTITFSIPTGSTVYGGFNGTETSLSQRDWFLNKTVLSGDLLDNDAGAWEFVNTLRNDNSYHVVTMNGTNPALDGVTVSDGHANGASFEATGAGIYLNFHSHTPIIRNCTLENNVATSGAAMLARYGTVTATVTLENTIFRKNMANSAAGYLGVTNGVTTFNVNVTNCLFAENITQDNTGADGQIGSGFVQQTNTFSSSANVVLSNCTFAKNQDLGTNALMNSTTRAVIGLSQGASTTFTAELNNCVFWGNTEVGGATTKAISNQIATYTIPTTISINNSIDEDNFSTIGSGNLTNTTNVDPLFTDFANNDFTLSCLSPGVEAGDATGLTLPALDLAGNGRILNTIDMGCYELIAYPSITAVTQNLTINLDVSGNATITPSEVNDNSGSTCGTAITLGLDQTTFNCSDLGANTVTLTATETIGGAFNNASATITVVDAIAPIVVTQNLTLSLDASGNASITTAEVNNGSSDNCTLAGSLALNLDVTAFTCADLGDNTVTLSVDDGNGNINSAIATVTVQDIISPVALAQNITANILTGTSSVTITEGMIDNGSSDNCSITMSLSQTVFTCYEAGDNTVTLTVTDGSGNVSTVDATVTVLTPIDDQTVTPLISSTCGNQSTSVLTGSSQIGVNYYLSDDRNNMIDGPIAGTGGPLTLNTYIITSTSTYSVVGEEIPVSSDSYALDFDGVNDRVVTTYTHQSSSNFTIEAWIKPTNAGYRRIMSNHLGSGNTLPGNIIVDTYSATSPGTSFRVVLGGAGSAWSQHNAENCLTLNTWNHIAFTFDNGNVIQYVNGVQVGTSTSTFTTVPTAPAPIHLGEDVSVGNAEFFHGQMDEVRFWSTARTQAEISGNKDYCMTSSEIGLEAYYDFEAQGQLTAITDISGGNDGYMFNMDPATDYVMRTNGFTCGSGCPVTMSQIATITVEDLLAPVADVTTLSDVTGSCEVTSLVEPTSTDNCIGSVTASHNVTLPISSSTTITWTYDDGNGNTSTQTQDVVINDVVAPIADVTVLSSIDSQCEVNALTAPTATDDCLGTINGTHVLTLPITAQGTTVVTWTYDDGNGNITTQTQDVVLADISAPVADMATLADITEQCTLTSLTSPTATDNCAGPIVGAHNATLPLTSNTTITWTYVDGNGNSITQTQDVVINDNINPVADVAVLPSIDEECEVIALTSPTATDNCAGSITGTHNATLPINSNTSITWTYDDGNGNVSTQTQDVVLVDVSAPIADIVSLADLNGQCEITTLTSPTATDNCVGSITGTHDATLPITNSSTITWLYDDGNGNSSTQTQTVAINDNTAPVMDIATLTDVNSQCAINSLTIPTATDNCMGSILGAHDATLPIGINTTVTWTYVDGNGNTASQTQDVIISDNVAPVLDDPSLLNLNDECSITSLITPTATDNCGGTISGVHNATLPISLNTTITWTYDDGSGNITTQNQLVVINDVSAPVVDLVSLLDITEECEVSTLTAPTATDNCQGLITGAHDATLPINSNTTITWTYDDGFGNVSTQTQDVVINDVTAPVADLVSLADLTASCEITVLTAPTATDNCVGGITGTHNATLPISSNTTITWTYDDGNGNSSTQDQNVVINDNSAPIEDVVSLPTVTEECEVTSITAPTATDNCLGTITGVSNTSLPILETTTVTWTFDDGNGNVTTQTQEVTITDVTNPVVYAITLVDITELCEVTSLTAPTATDNCSGSITGTHNATLPITANTTITWSYFDGAGNSVTQDQDVVINAVDASTSLSGITITANEANADSYQWVDCNLGNTPINNATLQSFTPSSNGSYAVNITVGNCTETSLCVDITTVGIKENSMITLKLYPNPTVSDLTIETDVEIEEVAIFDVAGSLIRKEYSKSFSVDRLAAGSYTLVVKTELGLVRKRFVKE